MRKAQHRSRNAHGLHWLEGPSVGSAKMLLCFSFTGLRKGYGLGGEQSTDRGDSRGASSCSSRGNAETRGAGRVTTYFAAGSLRHSRRQCFQSFKVVFNMAL